MFTLPAICNNIFGGCTRFGDNIFYLGDVGECFDCSDYFFVFIIEWSANVLDWDFFVTGMSHVFVKLLQLFLFHGSGAGAFFGLAVACFEKFIAFFTRY